jgi:Peptidase family M23
VLLTLGLLVAGPLAGVAGSAAKPKNVYTPVLAALLSTRDPTPVLGTDRRYHLLYELRLSNRGSIPATLQKLEVLDADGLVPVRAYEGADLQARIRDSSGRAAPDTTIEAGGERVFLVDLDFGFSTNLPVALVHRLSVVGPASPRATQPSAVNYTIATVGIDGQAPLVVLPPLRGNGWVVTDGCCDITGIGRTTILPVNGGLWSPLRYAVDLAQLDDQGRFVHDDPTQLTNYVAYGADVLAAAPGRVVAASSTLPDVPPGTTPGSSGANFENTDGNYVLVDHGNGTYAFYGNLQPGSLTVQVGDHVQRREVLGTIGNSADSAFPHLQFRLMGGGSLYGSDGLPFVLSGFGYEGDLDHAHFAVDGVNGDYLADRASSADARRRELPLGLAIIDFGASGGAGAAGRT